MLNIFYNALCQILSTMSCVFNNCPPWLMSNIGLQNLMLNIVLNVLCQIVFTMSYYNALCQIIVYNVLFQALAKYSQIVLYQILLIMLYSKYCSQCLKMNIVHNIFFMSNIVHNALFYNVLCQNCSQCINMSNNCS